MVSTLDETFQLFIDGRTSSIKDVFIDFIGGIIGGTSSWAVERVKIKNKI